MSNTTKKTIDYSRLLGFKSLNMKGHPLTSEVLGSKVLSKVGEILPSRVLSKVGEIVL